MNKHTINKLLGTIFFTKREIILKRLKKEIKTNNPDLLAYFIQ